MKEDFTIIQTSLKLSGKYTSKNFVGGGDRKEPL